MKGLFRYALFLVCLGVLSASAQQLKPHFLTNDTVMQMKAAGMSDELIITTIHTQAGVYTTGIEDILALKKAGLSDGVIEAMEQQGAAPPQQASQTAPTAPTAPEPADGKPRVYVTSQSHGNTWAARRDQSMELTKDFERECSVVRVTINQAAADYVASLNHIEVGAFARINQMVITDRTGDVVGRASDGGSIAKAVKASCRSIAEDWGRKHPSSSSAGQ